jgi:muramoyltetrapeptide carboxypeptidase
LDRLVRAMTVAPGDLDAGNLLAGNLSVVGRIPNGSVRGVMLGGNLSLVDALYGSPFFPSLQGGILFVEETNELGRKIDRMIEGLKQRGAARQALAVVVGQTTGDNTITPAEVAALFNRSWNKPVAHALPAGHDRRSNRTFWVGLKYELRARPGGRADLLLQPPQAAAIRP